MGNKPVKLVTLGGLTYNANQVKYAKDNKDGTFTISFKSGEELTYPEQPKILEKPKDEQRSGAMKPMPDGETGEYNSGIYREAYPTVTQRKDSGLIYDDTYFNITDVMGATFSSSKDTVSTVTLNDCVDTKVNLAKNQSRWYADHANVNGGHGNEVILDDEDTASIDGHLVSGEGTAAQDSYKKNE